MANTKRTRRQTPERAPTNAPQAQPAPSPADTARKVDVDYIDNTIRQLQAIGDLTQMAGGSGMNPMRGTIATLGELMVHLGDKLTDAIAPLRTGGAS
jgi:hypothetical protein